MNLEPADKNRRVLVIDDNRAIHDDFRKILSPGDATAAALDLTEVAVFGDAKAAAPQTQFEVDSAYQGQEGVLMVKKALAAGRPYAMAFVDVRIPPGWDGVETTRQIWELDSDLQVVLCTAYSDYSWGEMFEKLGRRDGLLILKKPFDTVEASQLANALTEKWWLHAQFRRKMEELESRVAERTHELQHTNHALETEVVEHCRAEESLRLLGSAVEQSKESIVITDAQLDLPGPKILFVNPAFTKMTGYSAEEAIGNTPRILQGPRTDPTVLSRLRRTLQRGEAFEGEGINYRKGGEEFYLEWQIAPIRGAGGNTTHFVAVQHDITARKRTEEALQERAQLAGLEVDVGTALTRGGTLAEMLRLCSEAIVRHLDTAFARVWTLNEREQMLELQASAGLYTHLNGPHGRVPVGKFKIGLIAQERMPHMTNQVVGDPRVNDQEWAKREGIVAFAGYPLVVDDRLLGVVAMFARHSLTQTALQALASVSRNIAVGIERTGGGAVAVQDRAP